MIRLLADAKTVTLGPKRRKKNAQRVTVKIKAEIVGYRDAGYSRQEIAGFTDRSLSSVTKILRG